MSGSYEQVVAAFITDIDGNFIREVDLQDDVQFAQIFNDDILSTLENDEYHQNYDTDFDVIIDHYNGYIEFLQEANESLASSEAVLLNDNDFLHAELIDAHVLNDKLSSNLDALRASINVLAEENARLRGYLQDEVRDNLKLNKMLTKVRNLIDGDD